METLKAFEEKFTTMTADNQKAIEDFQDKITQAEQSLQQANDNLASADTDIDVESYKEAKDDIWSAKHTKELYLKHKTKLENEPLITKTEYNKILSEITQIADQVQEELNIKAATLIAELKKISDESSAAFIKTNQLIHCLQYDIYKDADKIVLSNGNTVTQAKEYKNQYTVNGFYNSKVKGTSLAKRNGEEPEQSPRSWV